jgi:hypothetical protein
LSADDDVPSNYDPKEWGHASSAHPAWLKSLAVALFVGVALLLWLNFGSDSGRKTSSAQGQARLDPSGFFMECKITDGRYGVKTGSEIYLVSTGLHEASSQQYFNKALIYYSGELIDSYDLNRDEDMTPTEGLDSYRFDSSLDLSRPHPSSADYDENQHEQIDVGMGDLGLHWTPNVDPSKSMQIQVWATGDYTKGTCRRMSATDAQIHADEYVRQVESTKQH